ncbi:MAG: CRISPR system precrRNA processing endoribonuclease RAMP protein Cas6 [Chloroflexota bacterium]|nr:CRISPR system precrRNA processing endoribonuclease RAMP protein Cas6 [Chloroflexota bacterium]
MISDHDNKPELGIFQLTLAAQEPCLFTATPVASVHAALLRRLELVNPVLSASLHDAPAGASSSEHPWTISPLRGSFQRHEAGHVATAGMQYHVRITFLVPEVAGALSAAFDPEHPLGREPLVLEHVPFDIVWEQTHVERLATYASLLTAARPLKHIALEFLSPTGFRTRRTGIVPPEPRICLEGYLRKWNAFAEIAMPGTSLLDYAEAHMRLGEVTLHSATHHFGRYREQGFMGHVEWIANDSSQVLLRLVNALVEYAGYCGTGMKTARGMGQTIRRRSMKP